MTLNEIAWSFSSKVYRSSEEFNEAVSNYQKTIYKTDQNWKPDEIVFDFPELQIQYEAWISDASQLLENETLIDEEDAFDEDNSDEGMYQVEILSHLKADNGRNFTALEFLFKTHNQQANKELGDHTFFEGTDENNLTTVLPTFFIACGS
ncbi:hypothetical protein OMO38_16020 [Chryseobacterium sp. 09-1422]|uniref:Uncharacterized protein n=1 Tax=Chryseobacterium kimseyorum TaxID=2984028 RepID=A0ABT3I1V3_9FLAO|nr:hypothetical protein [Chryseobacterium kimseyorum]MCW3170032.1 hypothetical protein [Chryseobacterium kimseyorum]